MFHMPGTNRTEPRVFRDALESVLPANTNLPARPVLEKMLGLSRLDVFYGRVTGADPAEPFLERTLRLLNVTTDVSAEDLARVPATGPVVVVANHPFGFVEGVVLANLMERVRPDVRTMANHLLAAEKTATEMMPKNIGNSRSRSNPNFAVNCRTGSSRWARRSRRTSSVNSNNNAPD